MTSATFFWTLDSNATPCHHFGQILQYGIHETFPLTQYAEVI